MFEQATQGPPKPADNESMWAGLLALIRAIVLGRRMPAEQLQAFLLFAPPVEYLSAAEIYELLHRDEEAREYIEDYNGDGLDDWTLGYQYESDDHRDPDAHANVDFLSELLNKEHEEWKDNWDTVYDDCGNGWLAWRVLNEQGRLTPIAAWMAGKMKLLEEQRVFDEAYVAKAIKWMIEYYLENLLEQIANLHTWQRGRKRTPAQEIIEMWGEPYVEPFLALDVKALPPDAIGQLSQWMVDNGCFTLNWEGPDYTLEQFIEALKAKGWIATKERPALYQRKFLLA